MHRFVLVTNQSARVKSLVPPAFLCAEHHVTRVKRCQIRGGRGQELVSSVNVEKTPHGGWRFSRDAASKARPGPSARADLPQRKETEPPLFFLCFRLLVFSPSELASD